jgi:hypothetical protein
MGPETRAGARDRAERRLSEEIGPADRAEGRGKGQGIAPCARGRVAGQGGEASQLARRGSGMKPGSPPTFTTVHSNPRCD